MLGSFKEFFLLREEEDEEKLANKYDAPFESILNSLKEKAIKVAFSEDDKNKCELFVKKGLDRDNNGEISWKELEIELTPKNIGLFCSSQGLKANDFIIDLKVYLYFLAIKQNLGRDRANLLTQDGKLVQDTKFVNPNNIIPFYKKVYVYNGDKPVIKLAGENLRKKIEESIFFSEVINERKRKTKENLEKRGENVGNSFPKGSFSYTEIGKKLNDILILFKGNKKNGGIIFDKESLERIHSFSVIENLFNSKGINEASVNAIIKNPPKHNPFGTNKNEKIAITTGEDEDEKTEKLLSKADEDMKKKPSLILKNGEADKFVDGDDVSVNGNDANGKKVGIHGFKIELPKVDEIENTSTDEVFNKFISEVKEQLADRLDKVVVEYLKTHFAKQLSYEIKEEKFLSTKFKQFKKYLLNEETDFVKNLQLTKEMLNKPELRKEAINKLIDSRFTEGDDEFKLSKESVTDSVERFKKAKPKNRIAEFINVQSKFRHFIFMAATLLKKAKEEMDNSITSAPNNLDKVFETIAEDLGKEKSDDIYKIARYVFVTIFNKFKGNKKYIAKIMSGGEAVKPIELLPKLNMGKDDAIFNCRPKSPKFNGTQVYWSDWVRITSFKQLFNENDIKYWTELSNEDTLEKFYEAIETEPKIKAVFSKLTKEANNYIAEYNNVGKAITPAKEQGGYSTIDLSTYSYTDEKETKNIALKQRLARYGLIQKEGAIYDIVYKDKVEEEIKKRQQPIQQNNNQKQNTQQNNQNNQQQNTNNQQQNAQQSQPSEGQANATVTTAAVDSVYPPSNPFKKRMREIIYRKGPYTIKVKD